MSVKDILLGLYLIDSCLDVCFIFFLQW